MIEVYTDGACSGNPGPGGWAWAVAPEGEPLRLGGEAHTTNQRMEITAVLEALRSNAGRADDRLRLDLRRELLPRQVVGDVAGERLEELAEAAGRQPDLWKPLVELYQQRQPAFRWVKGHAATS